MRLALSLATILLSISVFQPIAQSPTTQSSDDPSYFAVFPDAVWFIQWTEARGSLSGQFQRVYVAGDKPLETQNENTQFTGIRNGSDVSLKMGDLFSYATWTGTLKGSTLSLVIPDKNGFLSTVVLRAGTVEDYNRAALALRARIAQEAAAADRERQRLARIAAQRQTVTRADNAVVSALENLLSNIRDLAEHSQASNFQSVLESYANNWTKMQADYETLKADAAKRPLDCYQLSVVKYDLSTLEYDLSSIRYDNSSFDYVQAPIEKDLNAIAEYVLEARTAMKRLQTAILANAPKPPHGAIVYFENYSMGDAEFSVDGRKVCAAPSGSGCTLVLQGSHQLYALTSGTYQTPPDHIDSQGGGDLPVCCLWRHRHSRRELRVLRCEYSRHDRRGCAQSKPAVASITKYFGRDGAAKE
jgi:hypothetical protein